ncbi:hypothetical protein [Curtobacterium sp. VKM Ac-2922]|uniref:hypothetical protein n=1 Tax=Curtobacterium sp. VKM Ac-2922 TaxID=2929475 RepID=UPI001FB50B9D|nr:hypothetical protein [Curtobacterium sp. VKM Ac-2922]MCJ1715427.1 hypothetical protein [Curtobacterium sp. VKM Ac-2922]
MAAVVWMIVIGGVFMVLGALAYLGVWRSWVRINPSMQFFGIFWLGTAVVCEGIACTCFNGPVPLALSLMGCFVLSGSFGFCMMFGGARWAAPRWYRRRMRR